MGETKKNILNMAFVAYSYGLIYFGIWLVIGGFINIASDTTNNAKLYSMANCTVIDITPEIYQPYTQDPFCCNVQILANVEKNEDHAVTIADCVKKQGSGCNYWKQLVGRSYKCYVRIDNSLDRCPGNCGVGSCNALSPDSHSCVQHWDAGYRSRVNSNVLMIVLGGFILFLGLSQAWHLLSLKFS